MASRSPTISLNGGVDHVNRVTFTSSKGSLFPSAERSIFFFLPLSSEWRRLQTTFVLVYSNVWAPLELLSFVALVEVMENSQSFFPSQ